MLLDAARFAGQVSGREVGLYVIQSQGLQVAICNHGARIVQLITPDRQGEPQDVVLGFDSLPQMLSGLPSMGAFIGRFANRIAGARYGVGGHEHLLPANDGAHCLHGGPAGSRVQVFEVLSHTTSQLSLGWTFQEAEDGFPGDVRLELQYRVEGGTLRIDHTARVWRAATPLNFTSHAFFNLEGQGSQDVLGHNVQLSADRYVPVDSGRIPTGQLLQVAGTAFDFGRPRRLREALAQGHAQLSLGGPSGFDHCMVDGLSIWRCQARVHAARTGIAMEVWSDAPGLQLYSAAPMDGSLPRHAGKGGRAYGPSAGLCLEPQGLPDGPNQPHFPRAVFEPGEVVHGRMAYRFSAAPSTAGPEHLPAL
jgi:aldose 1-epimerase